jgi:uncharacterized protein (DUF934 family)
MATLIKNGKTLADGWRLLDEPADRLLIPAEDGLLPDLPAGPLLVPLRVWQQRRDDLLERGAGTGLWLATDADPAAVAADLAQLEVVAIRFVNFTDGRGYSLARLLRERHGYRGELRAIGEVLRDQLYYLASCGFDAFVLRAGEDPDRALAAYGDFSEAYQASVLRPNPLFRRRLAGAAAEDMVLTEVGAGLVE